MSRHCAEGRGTSQTWQTGSSRNTKTPTRLSAAKPRSAALSTIGNSAGASRRIAIVTHGKALAEFTIAERVALLPRCFLAHDHCRDEHCPVSEFCQWDVHHSAECCVPPPPHEAYMALRNERAKKAPMQVPEETTTSCDPVKQHP